MVSVYVLFVIILMLTVYFHSFHFRLRRHTKKNLIHHLLSISLIFLIVLIIAIFVCLDDFVEMEKKEDEELSFEDSYKLYNAKGKGYTFFYHDPNSTSLFSSEDVYEFKNIDLITTDKYVLKYNDIKMEADVYLRFNENEYRTKITNATRRLEIFYIILIFIMFFSLPLPPTKKVGEIKETKEE